MFMLVLLLSVLCNLENLNAVDVVNYGLLCCELWDLVLATCIKNKLEVNNVE